MIARMLMLTRVCTHPWTQWSGLLSGSRFLSSWCSRYHVCRDSDFVLYTHASRAHVASMTLRVLRPQNGFSFPCPSVRRCRLLSMDHENGCSLFQPGTCSLEAEAEAKGLFFTLFTHLFECWWLKDVEHVCAAAGNTFKTASKSIKWYIFFKLKHSW